MDTPLPLPIVILGGRDRIATRLPDSGRDKHPLVGYKAVDVRIAGRPLIAELCDRLRACGAFSPIHVAGPAAVYAEVCPGARLIDTDGAIAENLRAALDGVAADHGPGEVAFTTCDILPEVEELRLAVEDWRRCRPCDFWMPLVRVPGERAALGASSWKPQYRFRPRPGAEPVATLPGHLAIVDPEVLRRDLLLRLFELAYRTRNRPVTYRRAVMLRRILGFLLLRDLKLLVTLRPPTATWEVLSNGLALAHALATDAPSTDRLATLVRNLFVRQAHRRRVPGRRGCFPILDALSLAKDVDTVEEAREIARRLRAEAAGPDARRGRAR